MTEVSIAPGKTHYKTGRQLPCLMKDFWDELTIAATAFEWNNLTATAQITKYHPTTITLTESASCSPDHPVTKEQHHTITVTSSYTAPPKTISIPGGKHTVTEWKTSPGKGVTEVSLQDDPSSYIWHSPSPSYVHD